LIPVDNIVDRTVLDCGCGTGDHSAVFARMGARHVVGIDISMVSLRRTRTLIPVGGAAQASLTYLPFRDRSFDLIWAWGMLHYVPDVGAGARELSRLIKPGGVLVIHTLRRGTWSALENTAARILTRAPRLVQAVLLSAAERMLSPLVRLITGRDPSAHTAKTLRQKLQERLLVPGRLHTFTRDDIATLLGPSFDVHEAHPPVPDLLKRDMSITVVAVKERLVA
jgi:ubiquinone/menaquinone biosynthesis C-methylase UbiE